MIRSRPHLVLSTICKYNKFLFVPGAGFKTTTHGITINRNPCYLVQDLLVTVHICQPYFPLLERSRRYFNTSSMARDRSHNDDGGAHPEPTKHLHPPSASVDPLHHTKAHADRKFYDTSDIHDYQASIAKTTKADPDELLNYIHSNVIGNNATFISPFGERRVTYCDYTASGRAVKFIEDFIQNEVLPFYGNTHTTTSVTSLQTTLFRHEARDIIRNCVNASEHDAIVFIGTGCTGAIHKLINALNLAKETPPVVFVGPYEHHSNLLPWRELGAEVIRIQECADGTLDLNHLEESLKMYQGSEKQMIGTFSAASNVTGILTDDKAVTALLHRHGALSFWDYACAGPYVDIDMNPLCTGPDHGLVYKDAIFISPHKFIGGPDTPGILVAKKNLFVNPVPSGGGGGSVFFVTRDSHRYLQEAEMREEGGTPSIVGAIRAGMVFQLKNALTPEVIVSRDHELCKKAFSAWQSIPELVILGSHDAPRLPIFSFIVRHPATGLLLHHNFICVLLNDLFGIQARGGCACAGPYAQDLLGIDEELASHYEDLLAEDRTLDRIHLRRYREYSEREVLRPGFVRINLPYFMPEEEVDFVVEAVSLVAREGWKLLPQYIFNPETGEWKHHNHQVFKDRRWLGMISFASGSFRYTNPKVSASNVGHVNKMDYLKAAQEIFANSEKVARRMVLAQQDLMFDEASEKVRWFLLPNEARNCLLGGGRIEKEMPFVPKKYNDECSTELERTLESTIKKLVEITIEDNINSEDSKKKEEPTEPFAYTKHIDKKSTSKEDEETKEFGRKQLKDDANNGKGCLGASCIRMMQNKKSAEEGIKPENKAASDQHHLQNAKCRWHHPSKQIFKPFLQGVFEFDMIRDGDRVLVCLSGGKDSLSLLHTIRQYQFYAKKRNISFEFGAVTVDPGSLAYDPSPLKKYLAALNVPYFYEEQGIINQAASLPECTSICSFCSRMKRGRIYACARREGYNVLALGQHLDDLAESFLMSLFHNGLLRTMKANYSVREGDLRVVRPFVYVREKDLRKFAEEKKLPVIAENCPACFEAPKERHRVKQLLAAQEILFPRLFYSLRCAMYPLMAINKCGMEGKQKLAEALGATRIQDDDDDEDDDVQGSNSS